MAKEVITILKPEVEKIVISIKSKKGSSLIMGRFIENYSGGHARKQSDEDRFQLSMYKTSEGKPGIPSRALKVAMISAAKIAGENMADMKKAFHVTGDVLPFTKHSKPYMRKDGW